MSNFVETNGIMEIVYRKLKDIKPNPKNPRQSNGPDAIKELAWTSYDKGAKLYSWMWNGMAREGDRKTEGVKRIHPTQKPVGLFVKILEDFSKEEEKILDLFAGSGPLVIAAEQTNRIAYMMEYEPFYCDVIIDRWEQFTGQKAKRIE